jgi:hypothetical protein
MASLIAGSGSRLARVTVDLLGAIPMTTLTVSASTLRPGRRVQLLDAVVEAEGRAVLRATAWSVSAAPADTPDREPSATAPPLPPAQAMPSPPHWYMDGYLSAVEWRFAEGAFGVPGPGVAWARPRIPLVAGEAIAPLERALTLADSGSGVAHAVDSLEWLTINTDLVVITHRDPIGEWLCLRSSTAMAPGGSGVADTVLLDERGAFGRGTQTLLVGRHVPGPTTNADDRV